MSDLIDRHEAIRDIRLMDVCVMYDDMCSTEEAVEKAIVATKRTAIFGLECMPSVEPEQSIAEWQKDFREYINMLNIPRDDYNGIMEYINDFPSVEPRKKGKWIDKSDGIDGAWNYCSVCGEQAIDLYDFCPNCGAEMREGEEDERNIYTRYNSGNV